MTEDRLKVILDIEIHKSSNGFFEQWVLAPSYTREPTINGNDALITQTAEYALRAIVYLADQTEPKTNTLIANATLVPVGYLAKVMQGLNKAGLVKAQRGLHGGFELAVSPEELSVLQIVNAVEPIRRFKECPLGLHGIHLCPLHRKLDDAAKVIEETFGGTTIADMINVPKNRKPLCAFPLRKSTSVK